MASNLLKGATCLSRSFGHCLESRICCRTNQKVNVSLFSTSSIRKADKRTESGEEESGIKPTDGKGTSVSQSGADSGSACRMIEFRHYPSDYDKKRLVLAKMYHTKEDIPEWVTHSEMAKAADLYRIRFNLKAIVLAQVMIIGLIIYGKGERAKGNTVNEVDTKYVKRMRAIGLQEEADAAETKRLEALKKLRA